MSSALTTAPPPGGSSGDAQLAAKTAYNNALIKLNNQRQGVLRNYGYTANFDSATGQVNGVSVDPNNPYGQLQTMLGQQAGEDTQASDNAVGRGLHGGLAHQAESQLQYAHHGQTSALAGNLMGTLDDFAGQQRSAGDEYNNTLYNAQLNDTRNAIMQQMFNTPSYGFMNPDDFTTSEQAIMGSPSYGGSPFSPEDTLALAHKFGHMTPQQLADMGIGHVATPTPAKTTVVKKVVARAKGNSKAKLA